MAESAPIANLIELSGGSFLMGNEQDAYPADGEGPVREVFLSSFSRARAAWLVSYSASKGLVG